MPDPKDLIERGGMLALILGALTVLVGSITALFRFAIPAFRNGHTDLRALLPPLEKLVALQEQQVRNLSALRRILVEHAIQLRGVEAGVEAILQDPRLMEQARRRFRQDYLDSEA